MGEIFNKDSSFYINSVCFGKFLQFFICIARVKDGIVDRFRKLKGSGRYNKSNPDVYLDVHIDNNYCTFFLTVPEEI